MKYTCLIVPSKLDSSNECPVIQWLGYTFWPFSYINNRTSLGIVAYDASGKVAAQWELPGVRYIYSITVNSANKTITFTGQSNQTGTLTWDKLDIIKEHFWDFNEANGTTAYDSLGSANGTLSSTVTRETGGPENPGTIHLDGSNNSYVSFGTDVGQFGTDDFTVAMWFKTSETIRYFDLVGNRTASSHGNFFCIRMTGVHESLPAGMVTTEVDENGKNYIPINGTSKAGLNDGLWHHVAVVRKGATLSLYIDGVFYATANSTGIANISNGNDFKIGRSLHMNVARFSPVGTFDSLYIESRALSAEEISNTYTKTMAQLPLATNFSWSPRNPVYVGTEITLKWDAVPGASSYEVKLMRDGHTILTKTVNEAQLKYTIVKDDLFKLLSAKVSALSDSALSSEEATSPEYYVGNEFG
ncbi:MAG: LamG domain-containing protein [Flavobacteriales bacterium]|nr:LamG domain-containing protein [Flavobacteriales bacterium]